MSDPDAATVEAVARAITRQYFLRVTTMFANTVRDGPEFMEAIAASTNECWRDHIEEARAAIAAYEKAQGDWAHTQASATVTHAASQPPSMKENADD